MTKKQYVQWVDSTVVHFEVVRAVVERMFQMGSGTMHDTVEWVEVEEVVLVTNVE